MQAGPHREQEFSELCTMCRKRAVHMCLRCGRPLCDEHSAPQSSRCASCEAEWERIWGGRFRRARRMEQLGYAFPVSGLFLFFVSFLLATDVSVAVVLLLIGSGMGLNILGGSAMLGAKQLRLSEQRQRRLFLAERKSPQLTTSYENDIAGRQTV